MRERWGERATANVYVSENERRREKGEKKGRESIGKKQRAIFTKFGSLSKFILELSAVHISLPEYTAEMRKRVAKKGRYCSNYFTSLKGKKKTEQGERFDERLLNTFRPFLQGHVMLQGLKPFNAMFLVWIHCDD